MEKNGVRCMKRWRESFLGKIAFVFVFLTAPVYGLTTIPAGANDEWSALGILFAVLLGACGFLIPFTLTKFSRTQDAAFTLIRDMQKEQEETKVKLAALEAKCNERSGCTR